MGNLPNSFRTFQLVSDSPALEAPPQTNADAFLAPSLAFLKAYAKYREAYAEPEVFSSNSRASHWLHGWCRVLLRVQSDIWRA